MSGEKGVKIQPDQEELELVFRLLYERFGPRHWWPAGSPFEVVIGAILTQGVAWRNVEKAIENLKKNGLLNPQGLKEVEVGRLESLIRPSGYFRVKARKLKAFVEYLWANYAGDLDLMFAEPWEKLRSELLSIFGIGPETADAILLYAGHKPVFVVDAYTKRVFARLGYLDEKIGYHDLQCFFTSVLPQDVGLFNEFHAQIDHLANTICRKREPRCSECPLRGICAHVEAVSESDERSQVAP